MKTEMLSGLPKWTHLRKRCIRTRTTGALRSTWSSSVQQESTRTKVPTGAPSTKGFSLEIQKNTRKLKTVVTKKRAIKLGLILKSWERCLNLKKMIMSKQLQ